MLTVRDIERKEFSRSRGTGYTVEEVNDFMEEIASSFAELIEEKDRLSSKALALSDKLEKIRDEQEVWKQSLITTQKSYDEVIAVANEKATEINIDARAQAKLLVKNAQDEACEIKAQTERLKLEKNALSEEIDNFKAVLISTYEKHINLIRDIPVLVKENVATAEDANVHTSVAVEEMNEPVIEKITEPIQDEPKKEPETQFNQDIRPSKVFSANSDDSPTIVIPAVHASEITAPRVSKSEPEETTTEDDEDLMQIDTSSINLELDDDFDKIVSSDEDNKKVSDEFEGDFDEDETDKKPDRESVLKDLFSGGFSSKKKKNSIFGAKKEKKQSRFFVDDDDEDDDEEEDYEDEE